MLRLWPRCQPFLSHSPGLPQTISPTEWNPNLIFMNIQCLPLTPYSNRSSAYKCTLAAGQIHALWQESEAIVPAFKRIATIVTTSSVITSKDSFSLFNREFDLSLRVLTQIKSCLCFYEWYENTPPLDDSRHQAKGSEEFFAFEKPFSANIAPSLDFLEFIACNLSWWLNVFIEHRFTTTNLRAADGSIEGALKAHSADPMRKCLLGKQSTIMALSHLTQKPSALSSLLKFCLHKWQSQLLFLTLNSFPHAKGPWNASPFTTNPYSKLLCKNDFHLLLVCSGFKGSVPVTPWQDIYKSRPTN